MGKAPQSVSTPHPTSFLGLPASPSLDLRQLTTWNHTPHVTGKVPREALQLWSGDCGASGGEGQPPRPVGCYSLAPTEMVIPGPQMSCAGSRRPGRGLFQLLVKRTRPAHIEVSVSWTCSAGRGIKESRSQMKELCRGSALMGSLGFSTCPRTHTDEISNGHIVGVASSSLSLQIP